MAYGKALPAITALANPTRRQLFERLRVRAQTVGELARTATVSQPAVSQHLAVLREAGLVEERREGTRHYFRASLEGLEALRAFIDAAWDDVLAAYAEKPPSSPRRGKERSR